MARSNEHNNGYTPPEDRDGEQSHKTDHSPESAADIFASLRDIDGVRRLELINTTPLLKALHLFLSSDGDPKLWSALVDEMNTSLYTLAHDKDYSYEKEEEKIRFIRHSFSKYVYEGVQEGIYDKAEGAFPIMSAALMYTVGYDVGELDDAILVSDLVGKFGQFVHDNVHPETEFTPVMQDYWLSIFIDGLEASYIDVESDNNESFQVSGASIRRLRKEIDKIDFSPLDQKD